MTYRDALRHHLPAALEGDPRAIERVLAGFRPIVARYCRARLGTADRSYAKADQVAQRVCLEVLSALPSFPAQHRPFLALVYDITAERVAREAIRRPGHPLDELPARQRDVVILRMLVGLSTEETAEAVGAAPSAVRVLQHRALEALRWRIG
jgi:RNA polymerase sigma-70 factor, ECF subfamily